MSPKSMLIAPPSETPKSAALSLPTASITARTSSIRSSRVGKLPSRSERPVPRLSNKITRLKDDMRDMRLTSDGSSHA
jgi:hypothetical protein